MERSWHWDIYDYFQTAVHLKQTGFTEETYKWSYFKMMPKVKADTERVIDCYADPESFNQVYELEDLRQMDFSLEQLWEEANSLNER